MTDESDKRKCPSCGNNTGVVMYCEDIPCTCGRYVKIEYAVCDCGYSWRCADGRFLDGCMVSIENVSDMLCGIENFLEEQITNADKVFNNSNSMEELIHKCLRCGEIAVKINENSYECPVCGFAWETDKFDQ